MASRPKGYGLTRELQEKTAAKYSTTDEAEIYQWFQQLSIPIPEESGMEAFQVHLQDGQVLCRLANAMQPGAVPRVHDTSKIKIAAMKAMKMQENISFFLGFCTKYGLNKQDTFQTVDLYEGTNLAQVQSTLFKVGGQAKKNGFDGPVIGVKVATSNKRAFDEQQLREGRNVIGLQYGSNKGANQAGMTPYGLGRQIINKE